MCDVHIDHGTKLMLGWGQRIATQTGVDPPPDYTLSRFEIRHHVNSSRLRTTASNHIMTHSSFGMISCTAHMFHGNFPEILHLKEGAPYLILKLLD